MTTKATLLEEKQITRATHRLFWDAHFQDKKNLFLSYATRFPALTLQLVFGPLFTAYALEAIITRNFAAVTPNVIILFAITVAYGLLSSVAALSISYAAAKGCSYVQNKVFANYLEKDYSFFTHSYSGALSAQATRLRDACNAYGKLITLDIPRQLVFVGGSLLVISFTAPQLAVITVLCMCFVLSFTIFTSKWRMKFRRKLSEASSEVDGVVSDALSQATTVKSFASEAYEQTRLQGPLQKWAKAQFISFISVIPADIVRNMLGSFTIVVVLIFTAKAYQDGTLSIAIVTLVQLYVVRLLFSINEIAEIIKTYETTMGSVYQSVRTMLLTTQVQDSPQPKAIPKKSALTIRFNQVNFQYSAAHASSLAVSDFNLQIRQGEKVGLVGFSGSGKTTLTKLLLRFMDTTKGAVEINGVDVRELRQHDLRNLVSYVPQEPLLFHRSIAENIAYGRPKASTTEIAYAARIAHVDEFVKNLPDQYETMVGERGIKLSGGQRQRVAIARAILKDAPILVLDEATSALDSQSEQLIQKALWQLMKGRTALVVAHRLSTIQRMDRIVVMDKGKIVQLGTHEELLKNKQGIYATLWAHQSGGYIVETHKKEIAA